MEYHGLTIDPNRDFLLDENGIRRLKESYMLDTEISPQERFAYVSRKFASNAAHAQRLYDYSSKHWLSYSTPILSFGKSDKGLPISCYLNYIEDTAEGLVNNLSETNWLSMLGGGVGVGFGIRSADDKSTGIMPHLKMYDSSSLAYRQGKTRRGSYAAYLDISHPDVLIFLEMRKNTGDQNMRCMNLHHGINITNDFMQIIEKCMTDPNTDDSWELIDPHNKEVKEVISAKELWQRILEMRMQTGEPYLHFIDTSNDKLPEWLKKKGLSIKQSNLCLSGDTRIDVTIDGATKRIRLDETADLINSGKQVFVESKNLDSGVVEYKRITFATMTAKDAELIEIEDEKTGRVIRCTPDHKIYTINRGYVMAKDLVEADELDIR